MDSTQPTTSLTHSKHSRLWEPLFHMPNNKDSLLQEAQSTPTCHQVLFMRQCVLKCPAVSHMELWAVHKAKVLLVCLIATCPALRNMELWVVYRRKLVLVCYMVTCLAVSNMELWPMLSNKVTWVTLTLQEV